MLAGLSALFMTWYQLSFKMLVFWQPVVVYTVRIIETQHRWEKPGITNPGFEVDPTASILEEKFNMKGKYQAGV